MAGVAALAAAGKSIERLLNACFDASQPIENKTTRAVLVRTDDFEDGDTSSQIKPPALSVFLYRVDFNKTMRAAWSAVGFHDGRGHLALDLHYLLTAWADNAEHEHLILGQALQCLETTPILGGPLLYPSGGFTPNECLQLVMEEVSTEALMRTFDSLPTDYRLSVPYLARVLRIDSRQAHPDVPVTTVVAGAVPAGSL
jgi:Pvc16 N-terminal domain